MAEYFIVARSFAAPIVSDTSERFVTGETPVGALEAFAAAYTHPAGLYAAECYADANAYHKGAKPLATWRCNLVRAQEEATKGLGAFSFCHDRPDSFTVNDKRITVEDPRGGRAEPPHDA